MTSDEKVGGVGMKEPLRTHNPHSSGQGGNPHAGGDNTPLMSQMLVV